MVIRIKNSRNEMPPSPHVKREPQRPLGQGDGVQVQEEIAEDDQGAGPRRGGRAVAEDRLPQPAIP